jgi:hypothetical protein
MTLFQKRRGPVLIGDAKPTAHGRWVNPRNIRCFFHISRKSQKNGTQALLAPRPGLGAAIEQALDLSPDVRNATCTHAREARFIRRWPQQSGASLISHQVKPP